MSGKVPAERREELRAAGFTCHYCPERATTWDHVVPRCLGGRNYRFNLQPSCSPCNQAKAGAMPVCCCGECQGALAQWERSLGRVRRAELLKRLTAEVDAASAQLSMFMAALTWTDGCLEDD